MTASTPTDRIHALLSGALDGDAARAAEAELRADPASAALLDEYAAVFAATAPLVGDVPECSLTVGDVFRADAAAPDGRPQSLAPNTSPFVRSRSAPARWGLRLAAAVLLGAVALAGWDLARDAAQPEVRLAALALDAPAVAESAPPEVFAAARGLTDYEPVDEDGIRWIVSYDTALEVARLTGRPVLLFIHHETCPVCLELHRDTFARDDVRAGLREFVPLLVNVMEAPTSVRSLLDSRWPYLGVIEPSGRPRERWLDVVDERFQIHPERLAEHVESIDATLEDAADWREVRAVAQAAELRETEPGVALALLSETPGVGEGRTPLDHLGETLVAELERGAWNALLEARRAGTKEDAARRLRAAADEYEGSAIGDDFQRVLAALEATGRFPRLVRATADQPRRLP